MTIVRLFTVDKEDNTFTFDGFSKRVMEYTCKFIARKSMYSLGIYWYEEESKKVDYSYYLGPDFKMSFVGHSTVVANHQSFMDIVIHTFRQIPAHVAKAATLKIPIIGNGSKYTGSLFVERGDKNSKNEILSKIVDR